MIRKIIFSIVMSISLLFSSALFAADDGGSQITVTLDVFGNEVAEEISLDECISFLKRNELPSVDCSASIFNKFKGIDGAYCWFIEYVFASTHVSVSKKFSLEKDVFEYDFYNRDNRDLEKIKKRYDWIAYALDIPDIDIDDILNILGDYEYAGPGSDELIKLVLSKRTDISKFDIEFFYELPSIETARLMLAKSFNVNKFLNLIFSRVDELKEAQGSPDVRKRHEALVKFVLARKGIDLQGQKIDRFLILPSVEHSKLLLDKGLDANKFLYLVLSHDIENYSSDFAKEQSKLVNLAFDRGARINHSSFQANPEIWGALSNNEPFVGRNQELLHRQIALLGKKYPDIFKEVNFKHSRKTFPEISLQKLANKFRYNRGHCRGLSTLWLYLKWLQFVQPEKNHGYDNDWFKEVTKTIATWDGIRELSEKEISACRKFVSTIDRLHNSEAYYDRCIKMGDILSHEVLAKIVDTHGKIFTKKYMIATTVSDVEQMNEFLKEFDQFINDDDFVFLSVEGHVMGMFKNGGKYYFYDPNDNKGEYVLPSIKELAKTMFSIGENFYGKAFDLAFGFNVCVFDDGHDYSEEQQELLENMREKGLFNGWPPALSYLLTGGRVKKCNVVSVDAFKVNNIPVETHAFSHALPIGLELNLYDKISNKTISLPCWQFSDIVGMDITVEGNEIISTLSDLYDEYLAGIDGGWPNARPVGDEDIAVCLSADRKLKSSNDMPITMEMCVDKYDGVVTHCLVRKRSLRAHEVSEAT